MPILPHKANIALDKLILDVLDLIKNLVGISSLSPIKLLGGGLRLFRYPLYILDFDKISDGAGAQNAALVGWRFLVTQHGKSIAVDFRVDEKGGYKFHSINSEGHIETLQAKIDALQVNGDYQVADLQVPGINLLSFWLQPVAAGKPHLISPLDPAPPEFLAGTHYAQTDFQQKLEAIASTRGSTNVLPPANLAPAIDTNLRYMLTTRALGNAMALDGIAALQRPAMKAANGGDIQKWQFVATGGGYYRLHCVGIGNASALEGGPKNGGALMIGTANQSGQYWRAIDAGNGYLNFVNMFTEADNYALDGGAPNAGALISVAGKASQDWKLTVAP